MAELKPWDQQPGEPDRWYGRFQQFLSMGPERSVLRSFRQARKRPQSTGSSEWSAQALEWRWRERAHAWDDWQRNLLALTERNLRVGLHHSRVAVTEEVIDVLRGVIDRAELTEADRDQARAWLPHLRPFLRDMLVVQRQEFEADFTRDDPAEGMVITADDLRAAQRELEKQYAQEAEAARTASQGEDQDQTAGEVGATVCLGRRAKEDRRGCTFLVCPGPKREAVLGIDALREVRAATGLKYARLLDATRLKLRQAFGRQRGFGKPIEYVHMGLRASDAGFELADGCMEAPWMNKQLAGVRVLLLTKCASHEIGDALGVPYVVTVREEIADAEAAVLAEEFWMGIGRGAEPGAALEEAVEQCASRVRGLVARHW